MPVIIPKTKGTACPPIRVYNVTVDILPSLYAPIEAAVHMIFVSEFSMANIHDLPDIFTVNPAAQKISQQATVRKIRTSICLISKSFQNCVHKALKKQTDRKKRRGNKYKNICFHFIFPFLYNPVREWL